MEGWEIALLAVTGLIAIRLLANMMRLRHDRLVGEVQQQLDAYRQQKAAEERRIQKQEKKKKKLEEQRRRNAQEAKPTEPTPVEAEPQQQEAA